MYSAISTSESGIRAFQGALDQTAHNLANVNNEGFKGAQAAFSDLYYQEYRDRRMPVDPPPETLEPQGGGGSRVSAVTPDFSQGNLHSTDRPLDLAIEGPGFFQVTRPDGSEAFTREGSFHKDAEGNLVNSEGHFLEEEGAFDLEEEQVEEVNVTPEGEVYVQDEEGETEELGEFSVYDFVNPHGLEPQENNQYVETEVSGDPLEFVPGAEGTGEVQQSFLESSNVDTSLEFTEMIQNQRALQSNARALTTANELWMLTLQAKT